LTRDLGYMDNIVEMEFILMVSTRVDLHLNNTIRGTLVSAYTNAFNSSQSDWVRVTEF
jgi:hypothetical protein